MNVCMHYTGVCVQLRRGKEGLLLSQLASCGYIREEECVPVCLSRGLFWTNERGFSSKEQTTRIEHG